MPVNYKKDLSGCIAQTKVEIYHFPRRYYKVFLWRDLESFRKNTGAVDEVLDSADAMAQHASYVRVFNSDGAVFNKSRRWLGDIHFVKGRWTTEIVAHECFHAANNICVILGIQPQLDIFLEERAAYIYGDLVHKVYGWLWGVDGTPVAGAAVKAQRFLKRLLAIFSTQKEVSGK